MLGTKNYEKVKPTLKFKTINNGNGTSEEKTHDQIVLIGKIKGAIQEIEEKEQERIQYEDVHDL